MNAIMVLKVIVLSIFVTLICILMVLLFIETIQTTNDIARKRKMRREKKYKNKDEDPYFDIFFGNKDRRS